MTRKDVVVALRKRTEAAKLWAETIPPTTKEDLFSFDYLLTINELEAALAEVENLIKNDSNDSETCFRPLLTFFQKQLTRKLRTDAIGFIRPQSRANQLCRAIADEISPQVNITAFRLLYPYVANDAAEPEKAPWILGENNEVINVGKCLSDAANNGLQFAYISRSKQTQRTLTPEEVELVKNHSAPAATFYQIIANKQTTKTTSENAKNEFRISLEDPAYQITASYGDEGRKRLADRLMLERHHFTLSSLESLLNFMQYQVSSSSWKTFLFIMNEQSLSQCIAQLQDSPGLTIPLRYKAVICCQVRHYMNELIQRGTEFGPGIFSGFGINMETKLGAADAYMDYVISDDFGKKDLSTWLKEKGLEKYEPALIERHYVTGDSRLFTIVKQSMMKAPASELRV